MIRNKVFALMLIALILLTVNGGMTLANAIGANCQRPQAFIVVDPGFSKFSLKMAELISQKLAPKGYEVNLATTDKFTPKTIEGTDLLVLGGPTYMGQPSGGLQKAVKLLNGNHQKTLLFITGSSDCSGLEPLSKLAATQGLTVIGGCKIMKQEKDPQKNQQLIEQLLGSL